MCKNHGINTPRRFGVELEGYVNSRVYGRVIDGCEWDIEDDGSLRNGDTECGSCQGSGHVECPDCDSDGEIHCEHCNNGYETCDECSGSGKDEDGNVCCECDGECEINCDHCDGRSYVKCPRCEGTNAIECYQCDGSGYVEADDYGIEAKCEPLSNTLPIYKMYDWLDGNGWHVDNTAGLHIHVEVEDYTVHDFQKLLALTVGIEPFIYSVTEEYRFTSQYCRPLSEYRSQVLRAIGRLDLYNIGSVKFSDTRYMGLNFDAYATYRKTVEFRYFYPQKSADMVEAYVELVTHMVNFAKHATMEQILVIVGQLLDANCTFDTNKEIIVETLKLECAVLLQQQNDVFDNYDLFTANELQAIQVIRSSAAV
jgi:hypothetical protein